MNADKCGVQSFIQLDRTENTACYKRVREDGRVFGYEVFKVKIRHRGDPLPGGSVEAEDRECYPGASSFGRTAWSYRSEKYALLKHDELVKKLTAVEIEETENEAEPSVENVPVVDDGTPKRRGRVAAIRPAFVVPENKFTLKDLIPLNPGYTPALIYVEVQKLVQTSVVALIGHVEKKEGERGKPAGLYQKM